MNTERLERLAHEVETNLDQEFNMGSHVTCLIHFTALIADGVIPRRPVGREVGEYLNLDNRLISELCFPNYSVSSDEGERDKDLLDVITREDAAAVVRTLKDTGKVDWASRFPTIEKWR